MNLEYLGYALDQWKGSLLAILRDDGLINNIVVEPMFTDNGPWETADIETYSRLLRLSSNDSICHRNTIFTGGDPEQRKSYFDAIPKEGDVFLDPDTGIAVGAATRKHVKPADLKQLLHTPNRVLMSYQHSAHDNFHERLHNIEDLIIGEVPNAQFAIYECGTVAMIMISQDKARIDSIFEKLKAVLRGTAERRIWQR